MTDETEKHQVEEIIAPKKRARLEYEETIKAEPPKEESKFKVVAEIAMPTFDTLDAAIEAYAHHFRGPGEHTVRVIDSTGKTVKSKTWSHYQDENGYRKVP